MKTCITVPTYNEAENIADLLTQIRQIVPHAEILVIDDNSPDKTGQIAAQMGETDPKIHVLIRTKERGRGSAGRDGFLWALRHGAELIVEMDADFSHHPRYLPAILQAAQQFDVVLGSRYVEGGREEGRPASRQWITKFAGAFLRRVLGVAVKDPSSGFRCWRREVLQALDLVNLTSTGPSIVSELLFKARLKGFSMGEVPIVFEDRVKGDSKLDSKTLFRTLGMVFRLKMMHWRGEF